MELEREDLILVLPRKFLNGVIAEVRGALENAKGEHGHSDYSALDLCQDVQDAIEVLDFAIGRDDRKGGDDG